MDEPDDMTVSAARANLSDLVSAAWYQRRTVFLSVHGRRRAALVPPDLAEAVETIGGVDAAMALLTGDGPRSSETV